MLSHVHIGINDFAGTFPFYAAIMRELCCALKFSEPDHKTPWAGWKGEGDRPLFLIGLPFDGNPAHPGNGQMIALMAESRSIVDRCYQAAIANGGRCEGPPGLRPHYHPHYYGAYFRDPEGNKLCVVCHRPS